MVVHEWEKNTYRYIHIDVYEINIYMCVYTFVYIYYILYIDSIYNI